MNYPGPQGPARFPVFRAPEKETGHRAIFIFNPRLHDNLKTKNTTIVNKTRAIFKE